jgi:hypothetical protein
MFPIVRRQGIEIETFEWPIKAIILKSSD